MMMSTTATTPTATMAMARTCHRQLSSRRSASGVGGSSVRGGGAVVALRRRMTPSSPSSSSASSRGGAVRVYASGWLLKNVGPSTTDHLGEEVEIPGDLALSAPRMVLGRQGSDSVSLEVCVPTVSGAHAMIEVAPDKVMVTDLSSTNGTFIEGEELQAGVAYELAVGGEVIFGDEYLACYQLFKVD